MSEPKKQRKPEKWIVLELLGGDGGIEPAGIRTAISAKAAIQQQTEKGHTYVAIPERNWRPYAAEVPPTPQAILRPVRSDG